MTPEEAALWERVPSVSMSWPSSPCMDCTAEFHQEQVALGLCDGTPQDTGRPRLEDSPLRAQWRENSRRYRERRR